jgi:hypothetical protein
MLHIEPIEEIVTTRKLVVTLDEDDIAKILVDPRAFQKALRQEKSKWNGVRQSWSDTGHATTGAKRSRKTAEKKSGKVRGVKCPKCHKVFKALGRHAATCTGNKDLFASVRAPSPLDE